MTGGIRSKTRGGGLLAAGLAGLILTTGGAALAEEAKGRHDYTFKLRPTAWAVFVEGDYETINSFGNPVTVGINDDLGYDDPYPSFAGEANLRWGGHDFWITGAYIDESESSPINFTFSLAGDVFDINGRVESKASIIDVNFRYGYSFFSFEEDGFRFGPTVAVSYTDISLEMTELSIAGIPTGESFSFEETLPIPTIGSMPRCPSTTSSSPCSSAASMLMATTSRRSAFAARWG